MLADLAHKYSWTSEDPDFVWTVAVAKGTTRDALIRTYGGDPGDPAGNYSFAQMGDLQGRGGVDPLRFHVQAFDHASCVIALENNGYAGSIPEIGRRCSADKSYFFSVFWNVNGVYSILEASDGVVTALFDPLLAGPEPGPGWVYPDWLDLNDLATEDIGPVCLAMLERRTGLEFDRTWLNDMRPTYRVPDPDAMLKDVPNARDSR